MLEQIKKMLDENKVISYIVDEEIVINRYESDKGKSDLKWEENILDTISFRQNKINVVFKGEYYNKCYVVDSLEDFEAIIKEMTNTNTQHKEINKRLLIS